jgi:hypothetical protein
VIKEKSVSKGHHPPQIPIDPEGVLSPVILLVLHLYPLPSPNHFTLTMAAVWSSETLVSYHIIEDDHDLKLPSI